MLKKIFDEILSYFPDNILSDDELHNQTLWENAEELRVRIGQAIGVKKMDREVFLSHRITNMDMIRIVENFCNNSIYAVQNEINSGYITIKGGHRIGLCGTSIFCDNEIKNIKYISSLNIRIAREVKGCSKDILHRVLKNNSFENTLIVSPPGAGKTTILRDMIRNLSDGFENLPGRNVSLVDERSEIAAMYKGMPQNDVGIRTDVMCNCPKSIGIQMVIRSMAPQIVATDEIGTEKDFDAVRDAIFSGVKLLLTTHGNDIEDVSSSFITNNIFKNIIVLTKKNRPGEIKKIYKLEDKKYVLNT